MDHQILSRRRKLLVRPVIKPISVLIVDDHEVVRVGLRTVLSYQGGINVVGEAATVTDALAESCRLQPDVVLMDVRLPGGSGMDACRVIRNSCPDTRVLFLSSYEDEEAVHAAVVGGASGYLLKQINGEGLARAIHTVAQGQSILDPAITQPLLTRMQQQKEKASEPQRATLSSQQQRVLALVAEGKTNKEIGVSLELSDKTVKNYIRFIFQKMKVTRRAQAAAFFIRDSPSENRSGLQSSLLAYKTPVKSQ
jgi:DNA-binding NarL/FixJ family response regulator